MGCGALRRPVAARRTSSSLCVAHGCYTSSQNKQTVQKLEFRDLPEKYQILQAYPEDIGPMLAGWTRKRDEPSVNSVSARAAGVFYYYLII